MLDPKDCTEEEAESFTNSILKREKPTTTECLFVTKAEFEANLANLAELVRLRGELEQVRESGRVLATELLRKLQAARLESSEARKGRDEIQQIFDMQWKRSKEADAMWREAHPGNELVIPDLGVLLAWLMERAKVADKFEARG
jgi:hypothetical protein